MTSQCKDVDPPKEGLAKLRPFISGIQSLCECWIYQVSATIIKCDLKAISLLSFHTIIKNVHNLYIHIAQWTLSYKDNSIRT